jgi:hypothetical protein
MRIKALQDTQDKSTLVLEVTRIANNQTGE